MRWRSPTSRLPRRDGNSTRSHETAFAASMRADSVCAGAAGCALMTRRDTMRPPVSEAFEPLLDLFERSLAVESGLSPNSRRAYLADVRQFLVFLEERGELTVPTV